MINMLLVEPAPHASAPAPSAALKDPSTAQTLGFLFFTLLKAAEAEVQAGLTGSKAVTAAALQAIQCLMVCANDGDVLAPVLPGLASGLSKIMIATGEYGLYVVSAESVKQQPQTAFARLLENHSECSLQIP